MNNVNKTLYIPLFGKSYVSKRGLFISDKRAEEIWQAEGFQLKGKAGSKWLAFYMGIRAAVFDKWVTEQAAAIYDSVVIHIGCGMDSRAARIGASCKAWYDVDFPEVIEERKRYFTETGSYKMLAADVRDPAFLEKITQSKRAIVVMEGVSMYLTTEQKRALTDSICARFDEVVLLLDHYTSLAAKLSKHRNPINTIGVTEVFGIDNPGELEGDTLAFVKEHTMIPQSFANELRGMEKLIFKKLYTGGISKKLYRLYEYKKKQTQKI